MIIACDVDNVLNNLQDTVINLFNQRYHTEYVIDDFHDYDISNTLSSENAAIMKEMYSEFGIYDQVKPLKLAQKGLETLVRSGHLVYLVTDAIPSTFYEKVEWLHRYYPFIPESNIISMKHKQLFKCDVMIEDNLDNLLNGHHYERICLDYEWNRNVSDYIYGIYRCHNWNEIVTAVNKICEEE